MFKLLYNYLKEKFDITNNLTRKLAEIKIWEAKESAKIRIMDLEQESKPKCNSPGGGCTAERDDRCFGKYCAFHCANAQICNSRCLNIWQKAQEQKSYDDNFLKQMGIDPDK